MTVWDWSLFGFCVLLILLFAAGFVVWVFAPKWTRDAREHPPTGGTHRADATAP